MKVLVAGATSVPGIPVLRELNAKGHIAVGLTRSKSKLAEIEATGAQALVGDVFDREQLTDIVRDVAPDAIISLLTTLPKFGPTHYRSFKPAVRLWGEGVPNLLAAAKAAGVQRFVSESVLFVYGYEWFDEPVDETAPIDRPTSLVKMQPVLDVMRAMERNVLESDGIVLRYGIFQGPTIPTIRAIRALQRAWLLVAPAGGGPLSWIHIDDVASATVAAVESGRPGEIYNIADDRPMSFREYMIEMARALHRPKPISIPLALMRLGAPYAANMMQVSLPLSNEKAKRELGWQPKYPDPKDTIAEVCK